MASTGDYIFLFFVLAVVGGIFWIVKGQQVSASIAKQKQGLKSRGLDFSGDGLSVKTNRRQMSQQEYIEKSQASLARTQERAAKHKKAFGFKHGEDGAQH
ncbi:hypothetical protein CBOM_04630 [Ceraceosorus bombacis]|uniref:Uncharacterized protein n=1 Tax=Ceraceosorus bombacis TaxID=401625 RepID=A0A0P1BQV9_9BASI|nr:hypothetical protein CBOM_04630 [Ceraceosorus bombacis]